MTKRKSASIPRVVFWFSAIVAVATLLVVNGFSARRLWEQRKPLVRLQAEHALQLEQIKHYDEWCERMLQLADSVRKERTQIFSMLKYCLGREDFVVNSGPCIVCCKNFYDHSQHEPAVFFYLPPGQHRLLFVSTSVNSRDEMRQFMFERDTSDFSFESIELAASSVYEIRFFEITPDEPSPAGFQLIGPGPDGHDKIIAEQTLPFPAPVVGVAEGHGTDWIRCLPNQSSPDAKQLPNGHVAALTQLARQSFRFPTGADDGPDRRGPRGGVRFFIESVAEPHSPRSIALDELVVFMQQPASAKENVADLFNRADGFMDLLRQESAD